MKSKQEISDFLQLLDLNKSHDLLSTMLMEYSNPNELLDFGIIGGYGDSFEYEGDGIILIGKPNVGKTTLSNIFKEKDNAKLLSQDNIIMLKKEKEYEICKNIENSKSIGEYVEQLRNNRSFPVKNIIYLATEDEEV